MVICYQSEDVIFCWLVVSTAEPNCTHWLSPILHIPLEVYDVENIVFVSSLRLGLFLKKLIVHARSLSHCLTKDITIATHKSGSSTWVRVGSYAEVRFRKIGKKALRNI